MHVVRGSASSVVADRAVTRKLHELVTDSGSPAIRVWTPPKQIAFGRRDTTSDGYVRARRIATDRGYDPVERSVGGNAVAYTGDTVAFAYAVPTIDTDRRIDCRYRGTLERLLNALDRTDANVDRGEPERSFCPGAHSIAASGKIAGIAQRIRETSALVGGCVLVSESDSTECSRVLDPIYAALDIPFDPESVGSLEAAGGPADPQPVIETIEDSFLADHERTIISAAELADAPAS